MYMTVLSAYKYAPNLESLLTQQYVCVKRKRAPKNSILKFLTVSSVSSDSIVKGIIDDIIKTTVKSRRAKNEKKT
jgi:hypothetical protein